MAHQRHLGRRAIELGLWNARSWGAGPSVNPAPSQHAALQVLIIATAVLVLPAAWLFPAQLILPVASFAALTLAGLSALIAWRRRVSRDRGSLNLWDAAGILALIGFGACMLSEPQAVLQIFESGDPRPHGPQR